jgi:hypothetical protein
MNMPEVWFDPQRAWDLDFIVDRESRVIQMVQVRQGSGSL